MLEPMEMMEGEEEEEMEIASAAVPEAATRCFLMAGMRTGVCPGTPGRKEADGVWMIYKVHEDNTAKGKSRR